jgi:hypothetical protein
MGELLWRLPRISAELVHLAGRGLHMQNRFVFNGLLDGRVNHLSVGGADCIHAGVPELPIAA